MHDTLCVNVSKCTAELCHPKSHTIIGKGFARNVEAKVTAIHQVYHEVAVALLAMLVGVEWERLVHVLSILETVSQIAKKGMIEMLHHSTFPDNVANAL